ncbi:MAG: NAD-dependent epimerase/dehydratase family protein [Lentisphaeria bacterium]|nr:NAD-dependent epimerase/dehydratase family protein [Lentisphaeria bacterium]
MSHVFNHANVLITGGLGFIGSTLAHRLHGLGARVTIVDNLMPQYGGNQFNVAAIADHVDIHISDVRNVDAMSALIKDKQFIFNLAGQSSHMDSMTDPYTDLEINCHAQLSILELCRKLNPEAVVVFASTRQIYGKPDYLPVDEKHLLRPVDVNGINKMAGEWYHILYNNVYGIRSCALRLTNTIGPRMRVKDARQTFLGVWIKQVIEGKPFDVWGGEQLRDFTFGEDAVDAFIAAAANERAYGKIFNLGGDRVVNLKDLAELLLEANQGGSFTVKPFPPDREKIDIGDFYADYAAITETLGWTPKTPLPTALSKTLDYYRRHLEKYR